jgi:serine phosphatase RsbU (regulator of sigma subunit)
LVEDEQEARDQRAVQGKLDVRGSTYGVQLTTSAEVRLQAVLDITQNLGHSICLEEVLPKVLDTLFRVFLQADRAFIVLIEDGELVPKWINTRNSEQQENFRISRTVMREVMDSKEAIISLDASSDERFEMAQSISGFRIRSMIVAPLLDSKGQAIGAIQMDSLDTSRQFQKGDLEILASIAVQAGIAIDNAQLHEALLERTKVEQDLELARQVQRAFLPSQVPEVTGYQLYDFYRPADQVGGDYFDYILLSNDQLVIVVADVVGHGVAAAMLMAKLSAETRYCLASRHELADAVSLLNQRLMDMNLKRFVTLLCLKLDLSTGLAEIVNAGHMLPIWYQHQSQTVQEPGDDEAGSPLGIVKSEDYVSAKLQLALGDELLLYTDGISEAPNAQGAQYGTPRLRQLAGSSAGDITRLGQLVIDDLDVFTKDTRQADDMCLVILRRTR